MEQKKKRDLTQIRTVLRHEMEGLIDALEFMDERIYKDAWQYKFRVRDGKYKGESLEFFDG